MNELWIELWRVLIARINFPDLLYAW